MEYYDFYDILLNEIPSYPGRDNDYLDKLTATKLTEEFAKKCEALSKEALFKAKRDT